MIQYELTLTDETGASHQVLKKEAVRPIRALYTENTEAPGNHIAETERSCPIVPEADRRRSRGAPSQFHAFCSGVGETAGGHGDFQYGA